MRNYIKFILLILFAIFLFWFFGRNVDWTEVIQSLQKARPIYLISAVLIICLGYILRAKRWQILLKPITKTSIKELFATTTVGFMAVFFVGRAGEIVRPMWLPMRDKRVRPSAALVTLLVERIFDFAAIICFFSINLIWFSVPIGKESEVANVKVIGNMMLLGVIFGFVGLYIYQRTSAKVIAFVEKSLDKKYVPIKLKKILISILKQLAKALEVLQNWHDIVNISFWTLTLWLAIALPTWLVLLAFDLQLTFSDSLFIMGFAAVSSVVPTPGGASGAFHTATAASLMFIGVAQEQAWAVSIAMHLVYFAPAVIFGLYYLLRGDISLAGIKNLLSSEKGGDVESEVQKT